jgi:hypothetical protein
MEVTTEDDDEAFVVPWGAFDTGAFVVLPLGALAATGTATGATFGAAFGAALGAALGARA